MDRNSNFQETLNKLKTPPNSLEAEQSVIGGLMLSGHDAYHDVAEILRADDFYQPQHRIIFKAIGEIVNSNKPVDLITVSSNLEDKKELQNIGGLAYLATIIKDTPSISNLMPYARIVASRAIDRKIITVANNIANAAYNRDLDTDQRIEIAESEILNIRPDTKTGVEEVNEVLQKTLKQIDTMAHEEAPQGMIFTGLADLDKRFNGFRGGDLIIIAARPSMGKTILGLDIACHNAIIRNIPVLVFSVEMPNEQLMQRMIANYGNLSLDKIRNPKKFEPEDWGKLTEAVSKIQNTNLLMDATPNIHINELRGKVRKTKRKYPDLGGVVVDYLQLVRGDGENQEQEITSISRGLKAIAKEHDIPVIALCQLNRALETRPDKRPALHDLRSSGSIEQDGDIIMFIYRDEVYNEHSVEKGVARLITRKFRNGEVGTDFVATDFKHARFLNLATPIQQFANFDYKSKGKGFGAFAYDKNDD